MTPTLQFLVQVPLIPDKLNNITQWASANNLELNSNKGTLICPKDGERQRKTPKDGGRWTKDDKRRRKTAKDDESRRKTAEDGRKTTKDDERRRKTASNGRKTTTAYQGLAIIAVQCPRRGVILQYAGERR